MSTFFACSGGSPPCSHQITLTSPEVGRIGVSSERISSELKLEMTRVERRQGFQFNLTPSRERNCVRAARCIRSNNRDPQHYAGADEVKGT